MTLDNIDLLDLDRFQRLEHHEMFKRLRAEAPVSWHESPKARGFWNVVQYADLVTVNRDTALYSSEAGGVAKPIVPRSLRPPMVAMLVLPRRTFDERSDSAMGDGPVAWSAPRTRVVS